MPYFVLCFHKVCDMIRKSKQKEEYILLLNINYRNFQCDLDPSKNVRLENVCEYLEEI